MVKFLKNFYIPFVITYVLLSVAISFYLSFNFYSIKRQILIILVSTFNGILAFIFQEKIN